MCSGLTCWYNVFLKMFLKKAVFWKFCKTCTIYHDGVVAQYLVSSLFWMERFAKCNILGTYKILNITNSTNLGCQVWFQQGITGFDYSNYDVNNYSFSGSHKIVVGKNVN